MVKCRFPLSDSFSVREISSRGFRINVRGVRNSCDTLVKKFNFRSESFCSIMIRCRKLNIANAYLRINHRMIKPKRKYREYAQTVFQGGGRITKLRVRAGESKFVFSDFTSNV